MIEVDASEALAAIDRKMSGAQKAIMSSNVNAGKLITQEIRSRLIMPKRINVQDSDRPQVGRNPVQMTTASDGVTITLHSHWTKARTKAIWSIMGRQGAQVLERQGLWVNPDGHRNTAHGYASRSGLTYVELAGDPKLLVWAQRADRGRQLYHHAIWLESAEARKILEAGPAVAKFRPQLAEDATEGVRQA